MIHVLHENSEWTAALFEKLAGNGLPCRDWNLAEGSFDLHEEPPRGVFYSRMSASAHSRGHRFAPEYAAAVLAWLEGHGRKVVNGSRALQLELSKAAQYASLEAAGIRTPRTIVSHGREAALEAARQFTGPFISKHNRAGKGLGVHLFEKADDLAAWYDGPDYEAPVDGILLLQQYIAAPEPFITRVEFVGGELLYAVRVDTSEGFELCPAEGCSLPGENEKFVVLKDFKNPLVEQYRAFLLANQIQIAGIEFITDRDGFAYTYDINTNTNYNSDAEARAGIHGIERVAGFLGDALTALSDSDEVTAAA